MALSAFDDKAKKPTETEIAKKLGKAYAAWTELQKAISKRFDLVIPEWGFTSKSTGWGLRLKQKERVILYMTPCEGYFLASFALGEKAVKAAHEIGLSESTLTAIDSARKYAEGRGVRFEVRSTKEIREIEKIAIVKMAN